MLVEDDRSLILQSLRLYLETYPEEKSVVDRFIAFIEKNPDFLDRTNTKGHFTGSCLLVLVALREAREESGLPNIEMVENSILDLDIHYIPANSKEMGHFHYDVRFLFAATGSNEYILSEESNALAWVGMEQVSSYTREASILRMILKAKSII